MPVTGQAQNDLFHIVFNINRGGMAGFGATLTSLIRHCSATDQLMMHIMCSRLDERHKELIRTTLHNLGYRGGVRLIDYDADRAFRHLPALLGDLTTYGRLLIPDYVDASRVLYLDSDLIVSCDVLTLKAVELGDHLLGAITRSTVAYSLDQDCLLGIGCEADMPYFNAGILLIDLSRWRQLDIDARWREIASSQAEKLTCCDQTLLNAICRGNFHRLPPQYNTPSLANRGDDEHFRGGILHFLGSPKPWDPGGRQLHRGYAAWKAHSDLSWEHEFHRFGLGRLRRGWQIRRSLLRTILQRWRNSG
ncbi:glycosyltransferase family 8 protein [Lewinella sp. JB7]|nr:glycosyltransferase family 8 protein [Lewinella sp. JB7]